jgi:cytoskeletal protein RodZ
MKTVGEILKTAREKKNISLDEVVGATKIKKEFLEAIENNDFQKISSEVAARGFIKNYAEFLGLSSKPILAIFKRDFVKDEEEIAFIQKSGFHWTPKLTLILVISIFALFLIIYLCWQYFSLVNAPYR